MSKQRRDSSNRRLSRSSSERKIFYVDDASLDPTYNPSPDISQRLYNCDASYPPEDRSSICAPSLDATGFQLGEHSALYMPGSDDELRHSMPARSKTGSQRQSRKHSEVDLQSRSSRRSSVQSSRSRINSCSRPTPLGNGRRNSSVRPAKSRRASNARRKDSVRPVKDEVKEVRGSAEDAETLEQARRHRRITMIILGTFIFLLVASILAVVVTLTQSTFLRPPAGSKELAEHRAPRN
ncbi:uncharacterized protein LOC143216410 [Lasioglossum baleicum]|uniref:uncharacterized protein LOC143216410 n=1 Tax=Lasioglossum baleicum TaxID=434251 RepID=UPI003FCD1326